MSLPPPDELNKWDRVVIDLQAAVKARDAEIASLRAALSQAADWFQQYGEGHVRKGDDDKAKRNFDREAFCRAALAKALGEKTDG